MMNRHSDYAFTGIESKTRNFYTNEKKFLLYLKRALSNLELVPIYGV